MDDATGEHLSMFFCDEEGAASGFHRVGQTIARYGLFCALYTDRGSHYFHTSQAGEKVDANTGTQLDERWRYGYRVHWSTLRPIGRRLMGVQSGSSACTSSVLCEHHERVVGNDNCVMFGGRLKLQIPAERMGSLWQAARAGASLREWRSEPAHAWQPEIEDQQVERITSTGQRRP